MIRALFETKHFTFEAYGPTASRCFAILDEAWRKHCEQYPDADRCYFADNTDGVSYLAVESGQAFRDGQLLVTP